METATAIILHNAPAILLAGVLLLREWQNSKDRRDLLDRIMSADFKDYKKFTRAPGIVREYPTRMDDEQLAAAEAEQKK